VSRLVAVLPDPHMALCIAAARPGTAIATCGDESTAALLAELTPRSVVLPAPEDLTSVALLQSPEVAALVREEPTDLLMFKPRTRLEVAAEALGAKLLLPGSGLSGRIENKLNLTEIAGAAGVAIPRQQRVKIAGPFADLLPDWPRPLVLQSPRGFSGKRTFCVATDADWAELNAELGGRPAKASEYIDGIPATVNAVVDAGGRTVCTSAIVQVTGLPTFTPFPLGSCGNDFTWRVGPDPSEALAADADAIGRVLAERGYRGHFGLDFVVGERTVLIEINARLTASFALFAAWGPTLLDAHITATHGGRIDAGLLPPIRGGQLLAYNLTDAPGAPLPGPAQNPLTGTTWTVPVPPPTVAPGSKRGWAVFRDQAVVTPAGDLAVSWRP